MFAARSNWIIDLLTNDMPNGTFVPKWHSVEFVALQREASQEDVYLQYTHFFELLK